LWLHGCRQRIRRRRSDAWRCPTCARPRAPGRSRQADVFRNEILSLLARRRFCICLRAPFLSATGAASSSAHRLPRFAVRVLPSKRSSGKGNQSSAASNPSFRLQAVEHPVRSGKSCTALLECARNPFHRTKNRRKQKRIARRSIATIGVIMVTELLPAIFDSVAADSATSTVKAVRHEDSGYW
jgi:hypothetical protein